MFMWYCPSHDWDRYCDMMEGPDCCPICGKDNWNADEDQWVCVEHPGYCSAECAKRAEDMDREEMAALAYDLDD